MHQGAAYCVIGTSGFDRGGPFTLTSQGYVRPRMRTWRSRSSPHPTTAPAAFFFTLTGNGGPTGADNGGFFPSTAFGRVSAGADGLLGSTVNVVDLGQDPQDGLTEYQGLPGPTSPRWGDYSGGSLRSAIQQDLLLHPVHPVPELRAAGIHPDVRHLRRHQGRERQLGHLRQLRLPVTANEPERPAQPRGRSALAEPGPGA